MYRPQFFSGESLGVKLKFTNYIFSEQPFYGNYSTLDSHIGSISAVSRVIEPNSHTITVISHAFAYSSRKMASKTVTRSIKQLQVATTLAPYNLYPTLNPLATKKKEIESFKPIKVITFFTLPSLWIQTTLDAGKACSPRHCSLFSPQTRRLTSQAQLTALWNIEHCPKYSHLFIERAA